MALNFQEPDDQKLRARISVFGVGGAGGNAVNNMIDKKLPGVDFVAANTDNQALKDSRADRKIQLGVGVTKGLGAGSNAEIGRMAAEESLEEINGCLDNCHMCFITAGMGGGTGTGAAPIVANAAREKGILTVGVITKPFLFEGERRMELAEKGVGDIQKVVDTLIVIPNQNLFHIASEKTTFTEAFVMADDVLYQGVQGVTDLMVRPGMINLDFADVRSVMQEMGKAMMGTGEAEGENRAMEATEKAIANPLLDGVSLNGATGVLINVTGGHDLTLYEMDEASNRIKDVVDKNALIKFGSAIDPEMEGRIRVSVVATGIEVNAVQQPGSDMTYQRQKPLETDQEMVTTLRNTRTVHPIGLPPGGPDHKADPTDEAPAETSASEPQAEEIEASAATAPAPHDLRAHADQARNNSEDSGRRETEVAESVWQQPDDEAEPALFDIDTDSISEQETTEEKPTLVDEETPDEQQERPELPPRRSNAFTPDTSADEEEEPDQASSKPGFFDIRHLLNRMAGGPQQDNFEPEQSADTSEENDNESDVPAFLRRQAN